MPNFKQPKYIIGIDEAGRGPLAGPVVVGGVLLRIQTAGKERDIFKNIRDSKKISAGQRQEWFIFMKKHPRIFFASAIVSVNVIDKINIHQAALSGARKVYKKLTALAGIKVEARLDGGLKLPAKYPQETIIKGDEKIPVIAAASIVAKVTRDKIMLRLHKKYPQYGFAKHKGYATVEHRAALAKYGASRAHRKSFKTKIYGNIGGESCGYLNSIR